MATVVYHGQCYSRVPLGQPLPTSTQGKHTLGKKRVPLRKRVVLHHAVRVQSRAGFGRGTVKIKEEKSQNEAESEPEGGTKKFLKLPGTVKLQGTSQPRSKDNKVVFVAGATGKVGSRTVRELLKLGFQVRASSRNVEKAESLFENVLQKAPADAEPEDKSLFAIFSPAKLFGFLKPKPGKMLEIVECDLENAESIEPALGNAGVVVCCIGASEKEVLDVTGPYRIDFKATQNLIDAACAAQINHFVLLTSLGTQKFGFPAAVLNLFWGVLVWKAKAEKALIQSGLPYTIVRPGGMERPTDAYKETHNLTLAEADKLFGGQVSNLQVAELIATIVDSPDVSINKIVEAIAETTAPLRPIKELLEDIPASMQMSPGVEPRSTKKVRPRKVDVAAQKVDKKQEEEKLVEEKRIQVQKDKEDRRIQAQKAEEERLKLKALREKYEKEIQAAKEKEEAAKTAAEAALAEKTEFERRAAEIRVKAEAAALAASQAKALEAAVLAAARKGNVISDAEKQKILESVKLEKLQKVKSPEESKVSSKKRPALSFFGGLAPSTTVSETDTDAASSGATAAKKEKERADAEAKAKADEEAAAKLAEKKQLEEKEKKKEEANKLAEQEAARALEAKIKEEQEKAEKEAKEVAEQEAAKAAEAKIKEEEERAEAKRKEEEERAEAKRKEEQEKAEKLKEEAEKEAKVLAEQEAAAEAEKRKEEAEKEAKVLAEQEAAAQAAAAAAAAAVEAEKRKEEAEKEAKVLAEQEAAAQAAAAAAAEAEKRKEEAEKEAKVLAEQEAAAQAAAAVEAEKEEAEKEAKVLAEQEAAAEAEKRKEEAEKEAKVLAEQEAAAEAEKRKEEAEKEAKVLAEQEAAAQEAAAAAAAAEAEKLEKEKAEQEEKKAKELAEASTPAPRKGFRWFWQPAEPEPSELEPSAKATLTGVADVPVDTKETELPPSSTPLSPYTRFPGLKPPSSPSPSPPALTSETVTLPKADLVSSEVTSVELNPEKVAQLDGDAEKCKEAVAEEASEESKEDIEAKKLLVQEIAAREKEALEKAKAASAFVWPWQKPKPVEEQSAPPSFQARKPESETLPASSRPLSPYTQFPNLKPPSPPIPSPPVLNTIVKDPKAVETLPSSSTPLSPYPGFPDLKPPTSPAPLPNKTSENGAVPEESAGTDEKILEPSVNSGFKWPWQ